MPLRGAQGDISCHLSLTLMGALLHVLTSIIKGFKTGKGSTATQGVPSLHPLHSSPYEIVLLPEESAGIARVPGLLQKLVFPAYLPERREKVGDIPHSGKGTAPCTPDCARDLASSVRLCFPRACDRLLDGGIGLILNLGFNFCR